MVQDVTLELRRAAGGDCCVSFAREAGESPIVEAVNAEQTLCRIARDFQAARADFGSAGDLCAGLSQPLAEVMLPPSIRAAMCAALTAGKGRLRVWLDVDDSLQDLPWELASFVDQACLGMHPRLVTVRRAAGPAPHHPRKGDRLKVLIAWADPQTPDFEALASAEAEVEAIRRALTSADCRAIDVHILPCATLASLERYIKDKEPDVFHFVGHGVVKPSGAALVLEGGTRGQVELLYGSHLAEMLRGARTSLAFLSACRSGPGAGGLASALAHGGVPAVLSMQFPLRDSVAALFARAFYAGVAQLQAIDTAFHEGRRALQGTATDWCAPVLCLTGTPGPLLEADDAPSLKRGSKPPQNERPFIGRSTERADVRQKLLDPNQRLVTITGIGGMGKTSLAKQVAADVLTDFPDGVWLIDCDTVDSAESLLSSICAELELDVPVGASAKKVQELLTAALATRTVLLVLDCFERCVSLCPLLDELLRDTSRLKMLVTSRIVLGLQREFEYSLSSMKTSVRKGKLSDAVQLFIEAAGHSIHGYEASTQDKKLIQEICEVLEGVPLAVVLAAGRLKHIQSLDHLLEQLRHRLLEVLRRRKVGLDKHAVLQEVIDGSFLLLPEADRRFLLLLQVFAGPFTLADAAAVCAVPQLELIDALGALRDNSLLQVVAKDRESGYKVLDTVREYLEGCSLDEETARQQMDCRSRHSTHYAAVALKIGRLMTDGRWTEGTSLLWFAIGNLRAASAESAAANDQEKVAALADGLVRTYFEVGLWADADNLLRAAYPAAAALNRPALRARLLGIEGALASSRKEKELAERVWLQRVDLCKQLQDAFGACDAYADLAWNAHEQRDRHKSRVYLAQALRLSRNAASPGLIATIRVVQAHLALADEDHDETLKRAVQGLDWIKKSAEPELIPFVFQNLTYIFDKLEESALAEETGTQLLKIAFEGHRMIHIGWALLRLGPLFEARGDLMSASKCYLAAVKVHTEHAAKRKAEAVAALNQFKRRYREEAAKLLASLKACTWQQMVAGIAGG